MGSLAGLAGEAWAMTVGGALCVAATACFGLRSRGFRAYDAREPTP